MKTQEEIEQLAESKYKYSGDIYMAELVQTKRVYFTKGYTQCQKDMADYIKKAIEYGYQLRCNNKPINSGIDWVKEFNSLNNI